MWGSCVAKVTPILNKEVGEGNWKVDTTNPNKILTVETETLKGDEVQAIVRKAGYKAEIIE